MQLSNKMESSILPTSTICSASDDLSNHDNKENSLPLKPILRETMKNEANNSAVQERVVTFSSITKIVNIEPILDGSNSSIEKDVLIAATLVADAKAGIPSDFELNEKSVRLYLIYRHCGLRSLLFIFIFLNHCIAIFEKPAVHGFELPYWVTMLLEFACILFYALRMMHSASFTPLQRFWLDKKNVVVLCVMLLTLVDMCCFISLMATSHHQWAYRWSRLLRPMFFVNFSESKQVRRAFRNIRRTLPDILNVLILFFLSIALFSLMGQKLFMKRSLQFPNGSPYFTDYFDIFFDLYVLVTTSNNPDIMMPAYDKNHWYALFFITYIIICLYIFMNIFLAVVYNNYRKHLKNEIRKVVYLKRQNLAKAFDLLKETVQGQSVLTFRRFTALMRKLSPQRSSTMISILWFVLDRNQDNQIRKTDFLQLADLLNVGMSEVKDRKTSLEQFFPNLFNSKVSIIFRICVSHRYFRYIFDILILVNAVLIACDITEATEWAFLSLFAVEIVCKIYTYGWKQYMSKFWNVFDLAVIGSAIIGTSIETILEDSALVKARTLDVLLVLRVLRLVKIIGSIKRFQVIVTTIMSLGPSILTYGGVLFVVYYMFAIVGMELFHDKISYHGYNTTFLNKSYNFCGNAKLNGSLFYNNFYCSNNFNNLLNSLVLLFELMVVNQWHVLASGFVLVTSKAARLYFFLFHLACVIIVLNIFTAFVLEAFILEYSFSKSKMESTIEKKIEEMGLRLGRTRKPAKQLDKTSLVATMEFYVDSDSQSSSDGVSQTNETDSRQRRKSSLPDMSQETDIRFHISKKKNVESLLQRMFESELALEDIGPEDIDQLEADVH